MPVKDKVTTLYSFMISSEWFICEKMLQQPNIVSFLFISKGLIRNCDLKPTR